jgi:hypothetical protein
MTGNLQPRMLSTECSEWQAGSFGEPHAESTARTTNIKWNPPAGRRIPPGTRPANWQLPASFPKRTDLFAS